MTALVRISTIATAAALTVGIAPAVAHHSAVAFDTSSVIKIEGTITQFRWINPHVSIKLDGRSASDEPGGVWTVEMKAPNVLIDEGWTRTALKIGDEVTMFVNPLRNPIVLNDGSSGARYVGVVLANGKLLGETDGRRATFVAPFRGSLR